jgi:hypothetical protein
VSCARLLRVPLLLVVLAHYAHLGGLAWLYSPAFTAPRLLNDGLGLGRDSGLCFGGAVAANKFHLGLDLAKDLVHASHRADCGIHSAIRGYVVQVSSWLLLRRTGGCSRRCWMLLHPLLVVSRIRPLLRNSV